MEQAASPGQKSLFAVWYIQRSIHGNILYRYIFPHAANLSGGVRCVCVCVCGGGGGSHYKGVVQ